MSCDLKLVCVTNHSYGRPLQREVALSASVRRAPRRGIIQSELLPTQEYTLL